MNGTAFSAVLSNFAVIADAMIIPKIVYEETINKYGQEISSEINNLYKIYNKINKMTGNTFDVPNLETIDRVTDLYEEYFNSRIDAIKFEIREYPNIPHNVLAYKAINKLKPFKSTGEGYQDALIWETVLELLSENQENEVIFVTNNKKDFFDDEALSSDLLSDLNKNNIVPERFHLYPTLQEKNRGQNTVFANIPLKPLANI